MPVKNWTESLARTCARRPWVTIGIWVGAMALAIVCIATMLGGALVTDAKFTSEPESIKALNLMNQALGTDTSKFLDEMIIVKSGTLTTDDAEFRNQVNAIYADIMALGPDMVVGGANYYMTQEASMVSADKHATIISFTMPYEAYKQMDKIYAIGDKYAGGAFEVYHTGSAAWAADEMSLGESAASKGEAIGITAALIILAIVFGAVAAALLPVALSIVAIIVALGLTALVGQAMDLTFFVTNMVTMMGLAVGIDYSLFILTRFREERQKGLAKMDAIGVAGATASRAVFFSGLTVVLALSGMIIFPLTIFISIGVGSILVVLMAIIASLTLLPAIISLMGDKVNSLRIPFIQKKNDVPSYEKATGFWAWLTRVVTKAPVVSVILAIVILGLAAYPYLDKKSGMSGINETPDYLKSKIGYVELQKDFHVGLDRPVTIVINGDITAAATQSGIAVLQQKLAGDVFFAGSLVAPYPDNNLAIVYARITGDQMSQEAMDSVTRIRTEYIPQALEGAPVTALVTGDSAVMVDFNDTTNHYTPIIFLYVLAFSFIILILAFRSIVISITAILLNLLSVGAAYGLIVLVFQKGVGASLFHFTRVEAIETWLPLFLFALLFGLSMDYHVFLLSRVRERYKQTGSNAEAVSFGLRSTGRLITGAALIMVVVFVGFALGDLTMMQQMGFGLAVAVLLDATLVRCILVPAVMSMLGRHNWYLPKWLAWIPNISLGEAAPAAQEENATPGAKGPDAGIQPGGTPILVEEENE